MENSIRKEVIAFLNSNDVYENHYSYEDDDYDLYGDDEEATKFMEEKGLTPEQIKLALNILEDWLDDDKEERDSGESEFKSLTGYDSEAEFYGVN